MTENEKKNWTKIVENSGSSTLTSLPVDRLTAIDCNGHFITKRDTVRVLGSLEIIITRAVSNSRDQEISLICWYNNYYEYSKIHDRYIICRTTVSSSTGKNC